MFDITILINDVYVNFPLAKGVILPHLQDCTGCHCLLNLLFLLFENIHEIRTSQI